MLDVLGDDYIVQHIINQNRKEQEERLYRFYIADALFAISSHNQVISKRYNEIYNEVFSEEPEEDPEIKASDIKQSMLKRLNGRRERTDGFDVSGGET